MKKLYILSIAALFSVVVATAVYLKSDKIPTKPKNTVPEISENAQPSTDYNEHGKESTYEDISKNNYTVKSSGNDIYVYDSEGKALKKLEIKYDSLREYDKKMFQNGVVLENFEDVCQLAEDFSE